MYIRTIFNNLTLWKINQIVYVDRYFIATNDQSGYSNFIKIFPIQIHMQTGFEVNRVLSGPEIHFSAGRRKNARRPQLLEIQPAKAVSMQFEPPGYRLDRKFSYDTLPAQNT